jgi:hypothetical protein
MVSGVGLIGGVDRNDTVLFRTRKLLGNPEFHLGLAERGRGAPRTRRAVLRGLQNPGECDLSDPETPGSFP